ncbi:hypothetical protein V5O48_012885 [Marasmius crinis-equi]|uniref:Uncharacterized protein n=1 Tax=Marasmius crinis-equi TaxID=585013 RepID=A0ABR3F1J9_9AGAR
MTTHRHSPRKPKPTERAEHAQEAKKPRAPRRCIQCGGPPFTLLKECTIHSRRAAARSKEASQSFQPAADPPIAAPGSQMVTTPTPRTGSPSLDLFGANGLESRDRAAQDTAEHSAQQAFSAPYSMVPGGSTLQDSSVPELNRVSPPSAGFDLNNLDPRLRDANDEIFGSTPPPPLSSSPNMPATPSKRITSDDVNDNSNNDDDLLLTPTPAAGKRHKGAKRTDVDGANNRVYATLKDARYGMMTAKRGNKDLQILRPGALIGRLERSRVNRHFHRKFNQILIACERLADETDCWLHIAANHPSVQGEYTHWMSPQMAHDVPPEPMAFFEQTASEVFRILKQARRHDVATAELEAARFRAERDMAVNSVAEKDMILEKLAARCHAQGTDISDILG